MTEVVSTRLLSVTANCAQAVCGGTALMMPRIGIDSEPPSVRPGVDDDAPRCTGDGKVLTDTRDR